MITINLNKINLFYEKNETFFHYKLLFKESIECYNNYVDCNNFSDLQCPCCKNVGCLKFHKRYERHLVVWENGMLREYMISIAVVKCSHCTKVGNSQKYHALLPWFILPYHIFDAQIILGAIYSRIIEKLKIEEIINKLNISCRLFYTWLKKFKKYSFPSSIILRINTTVSDVISNICSSINTFLFTFFQEYKHPFFLFRLTCVPLCITP